MESIHLPNVKFEIYVKLFSLDFDVFLKIKIPPTFVDITTLKISLFRQLQNFHILGKNWNRTSIGCHTKFVKHVRTQFDIRKMKSASIWSANDMEWAIKSLHVFCFSSWIYKLCIGTKRNLRFIQIYLSTECKWV